MMPSTIILLFVNGWPLRPAFEGSSGATRSHCSSDRICCRDVAEVLILRPSRPYTLTYGRHALTVPQRCWSRRWSGDSRRRPRTAAARRGAVTRSGRWPASPRATLRGPVGRSALPRLRPGVGCRRGRRPAPEVLGDDPVELRGAGGQGVAHRVPHSAFHQLLDRSEEHTSELQSRFDLLCRP